MTRADISATKVLVGITTVGGPTAVYNPPAFSLDAAKLTALSAANPSSSIGLDLHVVEPDTFTTHNVSIYTSHFDFLLA